MIRQCTRLHPATHLSSCRHCASETKHRWYVIHNNNTPNNDVRYQKAWRLTVAGKSDLYPGLLQTRRLTLVKPKRQSMLTHYFVSYNLPRDSVPILWDLWCWWLCVNCNLLKQWYDSKPLSTNRPEIVFMSWQLQ